MSGSVGGAVQRVLAEVGVTGFLHARAIDADREVALEADEPVLMASVFKIAVCLELFRQAAVGEVDLAERQLVAAASRTVVAGDCADIGQAIVDAVGASGPDDLPPLEDPEVRRRLLASRALDPGVATRTTPRELTALLAMTWRGKAGLPASANGVSWLMGRQLCQARAVASSTWPARAPIAPRRPRGRTRGRWPGPR
jgi:beta-lactamase class A